MNSFDSIIIDFINQFSQLSWTVDTTIKFIAFNHLVKGGVLATVFWWGWFRANKNQLHVQVHLISTLLGCFVAMALARVLALVVPFRFRPLQEESLDFTLPYHMVTQLEGWYSSSLPSDHAALFYALSIGMFYISKKAGIFSLVYTTLFIALPRVYLGLHYPTDIIAGAFVGIVATVLCNSNSFIGKIALYGQSWSNNKPEIFYPVLFIVTYQIADIFKSSRDVIKHLESIVRAIFT